MRRSPLRRFSSRLRDLALLLGFVRDRRSTWTAILVVLLLVLSVILYFVQSAAVAPYIYPLF